MALFESDTLDAELIFDLIDEINEHYLVSEKLLLELERQPANAELLRSLFRAVHTIKGDLGAVGFAPMVPLVSAVETLLERLRQGDMTYTPLLSDLVLLMLDRVRRFVDGCRQHGGADYDEALLARLTAAIRRVDGQPPELQNRLLAEAIRLLDPGVQSEAGAADEYRLTDDDFLRRIGLEPDDDLRFFRDLMDPVERRSRYWQGRCDRIVKLALVLNEQAGRPVDSQQLAAAVYVHDFGMSFVPLDLLHKPATLSDGEILLLRSHVQGSSHLLQLMPRWQAAREMVLQHHEASNGLGYPYGLREREICEGAKIIAVADTFDALTHQRAYPHHQKRPILRAVREINDCAGRQLSPAWVAVFNRVVDPLLAAHRVGGS